MKKFLSLVLALVMTMSLVTISAGAKDYADADKITYVEAVDVLSALGVLEGDANGFRPADTLKRSEAAKIICALNLTPKTAATLSADTAPFADVAKTHWAAGYIAEGVGSGILAGVGNNLFAPDAQLTGYAYLKMLLVSLGYDAAVEQLTGANWSVNVAKLADELELTKGNDNFVGSKAVTREEAALYALNTLKAETVEYADKGTNITINGVVIATGASKAESTGKTYMAQNYKKLTLDNEDYDNLGRPSNTWEYDGDSIGTYASTADYVLVAQKDTTMGKLIEDNNLEKKITEGFTAAEKVACGTVVELWVSKKAVTEAAVYHYETVKVTDVDKIDDEDELAEDYGASVLYTLEAENDILDGEYVDELSESKKGYTAIGDFDKDDVLVATVNEKGEAVEFALAESFNGEMTAKGTNYIKVDGTKYAIVTGKAAPNYDDTYTYYLDPNGIIIDSKKYEEAESDLEFVYVLKASAQDENSDLLSSKENAAKIKVMYLDGDTEILDYALATEKKTDKVTFKVGSTKYDFSKEAFLETVTSGWYAYTLNSDGEITLKSAVKADKSAVKTVTVEKNTREIADGIYASTTTTATVLNKDGVLKTYKGYKNFPSTALEAQALVILNKTAAKEIYIYDKDAEEDAEKIDVALFVETGDQTEDGTQATFYVNGKKQDYVVESGLDGAKAGQLFEIELDADDIATITPIAKADYVKGNLDIVSDDYVVIGEAEIELTSDVAVYQVSKTGKTVSSAELAADKDAIVILNSDGKGTEVFMYKDITILG